MTYTHYLLCFLTYILWCHFHLFNTYYWVQTTQGLWEHSALDLRGCKTRQLFSRRSSNRGEYGERRKLQYSTIEFPRSCSIKESACQCRRCKRHRFNLWVWKTRWSRKWQPPPVFLPEQFHGQRGLADYSPWFAKSWTWLSTRAHKHTAQVHSSQIKEN